MKTLEERIAEGELLMRRGYECAQRWAEIDEGYGYPHVDWSTAAKEIEVLLAEWRRGAAAYGVTSEALDRAAVGAMDGESIGDAHTRIVRDLKMQVEAAQKNLTEITEVIAAAYPAPHAMTWAECVRRLAEDWHEAAQWAWQHARERDEARETMAERARELVLARGEISDLKAERKKDLDALEQMGRAAEGLRAGLRDRETEALGANADLDEARADLAIQRTIIAERDAAIAELRGHLYPVADASDLSGLAAREAAPVADVGEGYRLVGDEETIEKGDEYRRYESSGWTLEESDDRVSCVGLPVKVARTREWRHGLPDIQWRRKVDRVVTVGLSDLDLARLETLTVPAVVRPVPLRPAITEAERARLPRVQYIRSLG